MCSSWTAVFSLAYYIVCDGGSTDTVWKFHNLASAVRCTTDCARTHKTYKQMITQKKKERWLRVASLAFAK